VDRDAAGRRPALAQHALPRQALVGVRGLQRGAGDAAAARDAGELGDLPVGRDPPARDPAHDRVDRGVEATQVRTILGGSHAREGTMGA
jgi:hypothetical protein